MFVINYPFPVLQKPPAYTAMLKSIWTMRTLTELAPLNHYLCLPLGLGLVILAESYYRT